MIVAGKLNNRRVLADCAGPVRQTASMSADKRAACPEQLHKRGVGTIKCGRALKPGHDKCSLHVQAERQRATAEAEIAGLAQRREARSTDASVRAREIASVLDMGRVYSLDDGSVQLDELASKSLVRLIKSKIGSQLQL